MKSLQDTLSNRFGFEFESREEMEKGIDADEVAILTDKISEMRRTNKPQAEIRAENDAIHILRVHALRAEQEKKVTNPFGYRTWWLTQETISGRAAAFAFPDRRHSRYIMRPEFLINYIAYNPTTETVRKSLQTIFPSLLGIRLGSRLDTATLHKVLKTIKDIYQSDEARSRALISEHSDALKGGQLRNFVVKYLSAVDTVEAVK